jgi:hypothetical protein
MELILDDDLKSVVEFMQSSIAARKLMGVAESLRKMAKLLWDGYPQEPMRVAGLVSPKVDQSRECASGCCPGPAYVGDGFAVAAGAQT